jgi:hypothetical protein
LGEINDFNYQQQKQKIDDLTPEIDRFTDDYVDCVLTEYYQMKRLDPSAQLFIEQQLDLTDWVPEGFGTADAVIVSDVGLIVVDLKFGKGVPVSAVENYQLRLYALGAYEAFHSLYNFTQVKMIIDQPRLDSVSEDIMDILDLLCWADEVIKPSAQLAWRGEGEFKAGDHCKFCAVKAICRENVLTSLSVIQNMFDSPDTISDSRIADILPYLDTAEKWIKSIREYSYNQAMQGKKWKGYKLVRGKRPSRTWKDENAVVDQLARAGYTQDQYYTSPKLRSPADLEKILHKSAFDALLGSYVYQGEGSLSLVPESDSREEYAPVDLDFGDLISN